MRYLNQLDYPDMPYITRTNPEDPRHEHGKTTTIKTSGCGLCSAIMVADRLLTHYDFELEDAVALSYAVEANRAAGTSYKAFAPAFAKKLGLRYEGTKDPEKLIDCLKTGGAAVLLAAGDREDHIGLFTHGGHYMAAIGVEPDGRIAILDPSYRPKKYQEEGRVGKVEIIDGPIILSDIPTLEEETKPKETPYHLFWRR